MSYGYIFEKDVSIKGGYIIVIPKEVNLNPTDIYKQLSTIYPDIRVYETKGLVYIEGSSLDAQRVVDIINKKFNLNLEIKDIEIQQYDSYFGSIIFKEFIKLVIIALILVSIAVLIRMKNKVSALAIVLTILFDLSATAFLVSMLGYPISIIAFIAFLMILGYAIDNNIVLATNILKEEGTFEDKVKLSLKVGYLMEATTLIVLIVTYLIVNAKVIHELAFILIIALLADAYFYLFGNIPLYYELLFKSKQELKENE